MFHPGKVLKVFSPEDKDVHSADGSTQAMLLMWDENLLTLQVDPHIAEKIKEEDIVLADYSPVASNVPAPKMIITKILKGESAERAWKEYKEHFKKRKEKPSSAQAIPAGQVPLGYR
jgi:hypothetical protein